MVIFHGELLVITRWYVNKRPTIMRHFPEHKPLETVSGLNLKNPWFCRVSDSPVHRCWIPNIVNSSGIIVTSSNSQMNPLPIGVLKVDFHGCVFSSLLQVMQNKQHQHQSTQSFVANRWRRKWWYSACGQCGRGLLANWKKLVLIP